MHRKKVENNVKENRKKMLSICREVGGTGEKTNFDTKQQMRFPFFLHLCYRLTREVPDLGEYRAILGLFHMHLSKYLECSKGALFTLKFLSFQTWVDEQLVWDPANHDGVETVDISVEEIWTPDLTVPER